MEAARTQRTISPDRRAGSRGLFLSCAALLLAFAGCGRGDDANGTRTSPRSDAAPPAAAGDAWFLDVAKEAGIDFVHANGATGDYQLPEIMGSGCAWLDHDGDGDLDAYLLNAGRGAEARNRLFENDGSGRFRDATDASGLGDNGFGMGCAAGDHDRDGDVDLYVTNFGPDRLYENTGRGSFRDATRAAGIDAPGWGASALFADLDGDGWLDLFVTQYMEHPPHSKESCSDTAGRTEYCGPHAHFPPVSDLLFQNAGDGTFRDVSLAAGLLTRKAYGLGVVCRDFDGDGRLDLFVANDATPNHLWLNRGELRFEERAVELGAAYNLVGLPEAGMGIDADDLNGDGLWDVFLTHLATETNTLYLAHASGTFTDATPGSGLDAPSLSLTGFGAGFLDADLDGDLDLYVVNGRVRRGPLVEGVDLPPPWDRYAERDLFFERRAGSDDGGASGPSGAVRFEDASAAAGARARRPLIGRGLALGDYDDDGDVDLLTTACGGEARLLRNDAPRRGKWLRVRALERGSDALGALVTVTVAGRSQRRLLHPARSYLSSSDPRLHFGCGAADTAEVSVRWPDGTTTARTTATDRMLVIEKEAGAESPRPAQRDGTGDG